MGGVPLPTFGSGEEGYVLRFAPVGATANTFLLMDRISAMGGLSGTNTGVQTVNLGVYTAVADGRLRSDLLDAEWYVEIYADLGTTATNLTVTYTDVNNTSSKTVVITGFTGTSPLNRRGRLVAIMPTDGIQIQSVQSVQLSASSGTAGNFGVTVYKQICELGQSIANVMGVGADAISQGLPRIQQKSCLSLVVQCTTTSTGNVMGRLNVGSG